MASANTSGSDVIFSCSICLDVFNSPVSTPCGHNYCRTCITKFWDEQVKYKCPLFNTRPDLRINTLLSELAGQFRTSVRVKEQLYVKPGEVPCDVCTEERLKSTEKQAEGLIKELEQEIEDLTNRSLEVKQLLHTNDHLHFLQAFRSLKDPPPTRDWTTVEVRPPSYVGTLRRSLDQLEETLNMEMKKLRDAELKRVQQYEVDVTLDPDTAHPNLILSDDGKQVHYGGVVKKLPDNPKRFTQCVCVLTRQSFSSGRFYFEVQVKDKTAWDLGVARESINRIGQITLSPERGYWTIKFNNGGLVFGCNTSVRVPLRAELQKVGVFVDYDEGLVSFYDVEARVHIYSATCCSFSEPLYPFLSPCLHKEGTNSAPLILSPVNQTD
ncbi:E3 ubiquitin-protein ligase TRIM39-like [Gadus morhua]|uniref:E3 ubiquitin-protein ligase TRIM39-like n=1 Tax=Gadus morhua TaxID=8049 RepID=UPI0011B4AF33|nr:E3 ubiquitin-protein ligase TRIM39-like [Gadus morhua]